MPLAASVVTFIATSDAINFATAASRLNGRPASRLRAAFAVLALHPNDPWQACLTAASLGGDSDTIAAMAGAIAGACHGIDAWPLEAVQTVREINQLELETPADKLLALRIGS